MLLIHAALLLAIRYILCNYCPVFNQITVNVFHLLSFVSNLLPPKLIS